MILFLIHVGLCFVGFFNQPQWNRHMCNDLENQEGAAAALNGRLDLWEVFCGFTGI